MAMDIPKRMSTHQAFLGDSERRHTAQPCRATVPALKLLVRWGNQAVVMRNIVCESTCSERKQTSQLYDPGTGERANAPLYVKVHTFVATRYELSVPFNEGNIEECGASVQMKRMATTPLTCANEVHMIEPHIVNCFFSNCSL